MNKIKKYYLLTKPGIIRGNLLTATAGFLLASQGSINVYLLLSVILGISLVIACGCVLNNYIDIEIDKKMERTKSRSLVTGDISVSNAIVFSIILGISGLSILYLFTNLLTLILGIIGLLSYLVIYGYFKRKSVYGTLIGSVSGSLPPVAGYTAVSNGLDIGAWLLFLVLTIWQMPHFYAISIYRLEDYKRARLPVLSVVEGIATTRIHIISYIVAFIFVSSLFYFSGITGLFYLFCMILVGIYWLKISLSKDYYKNADKWAKSVFGFSLVVILVFSIVISLNGILS